MIRFDNMQTEMSWLCCRQFN